MRTRLYSNIQGILMFYALNMVFTYILSIRIKVSSIWRMDASEFSGCCTVHLFGTLYHGNACTAFAITFMFFQPQSKSRATEDYKNTFFLFCLFAFINMSFPHLPAMNGCDGSYSCQRLVQVQQWSGEHFLILKTVSLNLEFIACALVPFS